MNATELMLGDWVYAKVQVDDTGTEPVFERTPKRVTDLTKGINGIYVEGTSTFAGAEIEPIPLTPEILKENGFDGRGAQFICDHICMIWWKDNIFMFSKYIRHEDLPTENISINIGYVHELQHALRLCNIGKEIVL